MSGGRFNYQDSALKHEMFGWYDSDGKIPNVMEDREISELVYDVLELIHDYDWYASGDTRKDTYLKQKAAFKKKWLKNSGVRVKRIVDESIENVRQELYETFGIKDKPITNGERLKKDYPNGEIFTQYESMNAVVVKFPKDWWESEA